MKNLSGKTAVVTGAASGIGRSLALKLAGLGASVVAVDFDRDGLAKLGQQIERNSDHLLRHLDVSDRAAIEQLAADVQSRYGGADIIVNNAGVSLSDTVENMNYDDMEWIIGINLWGVIYGTKAFLPQLLRAPEGHIVNISSVFGLIAVPTQSAYNITKFGVRGFTESLRHELKNTNVSATCVHPGGIQTNIARNGRIRTAYNADSKDEAVAQFDQLARTSPDRAADKIIGAIRRRKKRLLIGPDAVLIDVVQRLVPVRYWSIMDTVFPTKVKD